MKHTFSWKTSLLAAALSASGSAGLFCLALVIISAGMAPIAAHPLDVTFGIVGGVLALGLSILLLWRYTKARKAYPSVVGVVLDLLLLMVLFVPFFSLWGWVESLLSRIF